MSETAIVLLVSLFSFAAGVAGSIAFVLYPWKRKNG